MESNLLTVISLHGWRIGQWKLHRCSPCVHRCLHQVSPWSGMTIFMQILRIKLVLLNFRRYLGEIESGAGNNLVFFMYFVFCVCSAVSGSALPMFKSQLSNKSGGAKAFGNMSVFDWPRSNWWLMCDLVWVWSLWHRFKKWNACCACCRVVSFQTARSYRELTTEVKRLLNIITRFRTARAIGTATANRQIYACAFGLCRF